MTRLRCISARLAILRFSSRKRNFISRFNWTSCIAPLPRDIGEHHGLYACSSAFRLYIACRVHAYALRGCFRCHACACASTHSHPRRPVSPPSRAARIIARHALRFFVSGSRRLGVNRTMISLLLILTGLITRASRVEFGTRAASRTRTRVHLCTRACYIARVVSA